MAAQDKAWIDFELASARAGDPSWRLFELQLAGRAVPNGVRTGY